MRLFPFALAAPVAVSLAAPVLAQTAAPTAASTAAPIAAPAADYDRATPVAGTWAYAPSAGGGMATFRDSAGRPQLTVTCSRANRQVTIARPSSRAAPYLFVWTSSSTRNLPASFHPATNQLSAAVAASDPILDAIAFSRGRLAFAMSGAPALVVPSWPEPDRVVEDCRS